MQIDEGYDPKWDERVIAQAVAELEREHGGPVIVLDAFTATFADTEERSAGIWLAPGTPECFYAWRVNDDLTLGRRLSRDADRHEYFFAKLALAAEDPADRAERRARTPGLCLWQ